MEKEVFELDLEVWVRLTSLGMVASRRSERILSIRNTMVRGRTAQILFWKQQVYKIEWE